MFSTAYIEWGADNYQPEDNIYHELRGQTSCLTQVEEELQGIRENHRVRRSNLTTQNNTEDPTFVGDMPPKSAYRSGFEDERGRP